MTERSTNFFVKLDLGYGTIYRWSDIGTYVSESGTDYYYENRIIEPIDYSEESFDEGLLDQGTIDVILSDADGVITDLYNNSDIRDKDILIYAKSTKYVTESSGTNNKWYSGEEWYSGEAWKTFGDRTYLKVTDLFSFYGKVIGIELESLTKAKISVAIRKPDVLNGNLPKDIVDQTTEWSWDCDGTTYYPIDQGKPIPIVFGYAKSVPLVYIRHKACSAGSDEWWYLIGYGPIEGVTTVYRNGIVVPSGEYTFYNPGDSGNPFSYAVIKFTKVQKDFSDSLYTLTADVKGLKMGGTSAERNFVNVIKNILSDSTWGLGESVDSSSFSSAASASIDNDTGTMDDLKCDGYIAEQRSIQDILNELLFCCRCRLYKNEDGDWCIQVNKNEASSNDAGSFGLGDGYYENIIKVDSRYKLSSDSTIKSIQVRYGWYLNQTNKQYSFKYTYPPDGPLDITGRTFGNERVQELHFVQSHTTAERICKFFKGLHQYSDDRLKLTIDYSGRDLELWDIIKIYIPSLGLTGDRYRIVRISKDKTGVDVELAKHDDSTYDYTSDSTQDDNDGDTTPDYSMSNPYPPTSFSVDSSGTNISSDGTVLSYFVLKADEPTTNPDNFDHIVFGYRKNGETTYTWLKGTLDSGTTWKVRIGELTPGLYYDFIAKSVNKWLLESPPSGESNPTITNQLSPGDTTAPSAPSTVTATGKISRIMLDWADNTEDDLKGYVVHRSTTNGFTPSSSNKIATVDVSRFEDSSVSYGTTYYYKIKAIDFTGNESAPSVQVYASPLKADGDDINDGAITTDHISTSGLSANVIKTGTISANQIITLDNGANLILKNKTSSLDPAEIKFYSSSYSLATIWGDEQGTSLFLTISPLTTSADRNLWFGLTTGYRWLHIHTVFDYTSGYWRLLTSTGSGNYVELVHANNDGLRINTDNNNAAFGVRSGGVNYYGKPTTYTSYPYITELKVVKSGSYVTDVKYRKINMGFQCGICTGYTEDATWYTAST